MRLSELFEDAEASRKERAFQDAWTSSQPMLRAKKIPPTYYGKVQSRAHELAISYGMDVDDSISTAASEISAKISSKTPTSVSKSPVAQPKPQSQRYSKRTGKRWGNQYYSDPASSGGIRGAIAKNSPKNIAKNALKKIDTELGNIMDIEKAFTGNLNKNSRRKR